MFNQKAMRKVLFTASVALVVMSLLMAMSSAALAGGKSKSGGDDQYKESKKPNVFWD